MRTPFARINRYRGSGHKLAGYCAFWIAFMVPYIAVSWGLPWWRVTLVGITYAVAVLWLFKWHVDSDGMRDLKNIRHSWLVKGTGSFFLLGVALLDPLTACVGFLMERAGTYYYRALHPETADSLQRAEYDTGDLFFWLGWALPLAVAGVKRAAGI